MSKGCSITGSALVVLALGLTDTVYGKQRHTLKQHGRHQRKGKTGDSMDILGTVYLNNNDGSYRIELGTMDCENGVSCGYFSDSLNETGWGILDLASCTSNSVQYKDEQCMKAAGVLEGYITAQEIYRAWLPMWSNERDIFEPYREQITNWTDTQREWMKQMYREYPNDPYWQYINLLNQQYEGLQQGYQMALDSIGNELGIEPLGQFEFDYLNLNAELYDLVTKFDSSKRIDWFNTKNGTNFTPSLALRKHLEMGRCSGIVSVTPELDDIFISHSTWSSYYDMNRVYKMYHLSLNNIDERNMNRIHFSSYPGALSSIDDYYVLDSGLAIFETTNNVYNTELFDLLKPESMFVWQRVRVASSLANSAQSWINEFGKYNSGTYNNQWVALDLNLFEPNQPLNQNLLWISEQLPGYYESMDATDILERGYWPSYNVPALPKIYKLSGNAAMADTYGPSMSYDLAPRARLFRAYANEMSSNLTSLMKFMRYNQYQTDELEKSDPGWAIMSRYDLSRVNAGAFGGVDTKIASYSELKMMSSWIQNGPTHDDQSPFSWDQFPDVPHQYLPKVYNFDWIQVSSLF